MPDKQHIEDATIDVMVLSYYYSPGDKWISVSGQLLIKGAPWVKFHNTVEVNDVADEVEALRQKLAASLVNKADKLGKPNEFNQP